MNPALQNLLNILTEITGIAGIVAPLTGPIGAGVAEGVKVAAALEAIVSNAIAAHDSALGSPIDLTKLAPIAPVS